MNAAFQVIDHKGKSAVKETTVSGPAGIVIENVERGTANQYATLLNAAYQNGYARGMAEADRRKGVEFW